jgi:hypothetical protein
MVTNGRIDQALAALANVGENNFAARREVLDLIAPDLLHRPALGGQITARLCATSAESSEAEGLFELLDAGLDAARMARESDKARGQAFFDTVEDALILAKRQGRMTASHSLLFAQLWARNGLTAPEALEIPRDEEITLQDMRGDGPANDNSILDGLLADFSRQAGGNPLALHAALTETFPAMPEEMREQVVAYSATRRDPVHAEMACFWLLDAAPNLRLAAAEGLSERLACGEFSARTLATLVVLRSWMPQDNARRQVDHLLKDALRRGVAQETEPAPWVIKQISASLPDGGGAQSIGIALQSGKKRAMAMLLLKQGHGVKDAYTIPCRGAKDQTVLLARLADEVGALPVTVDYLKRALGIALADGLAQDHPPAPGLIDIMRLCGLTDLRPTPKSTPELIAGLETAAALALFSPTQRGRLINASEEWWDRYAVLESWFEDSDAAQGILDQARSPRVAEAALWKWLETRRDRWARIFARAADVLETAKEPEAASFTACAMALIEGRDLKKIPVMLDIHDQTIEAWIRDDPEIDPAATLEQFVEDAPEPEKKGEFARLLRGSDLTTDWVDGYLTSIVISPKMIPPNDWLAPVLPAVLLHLDPSKFQRFMDILMLHAQLASDQSCDSAVFLAAMTKRKRKGQINWGAGFLFAAKEFRSFWPKSKLTTEDRRLLEITTDELDPTALPELGVLLAHRQARNMGQLLKP